MSRSCRALVGVITTTGSQREEGTDIPVSRHLRRSSGGFIVFGFFPQTLYKISECGMHIPRFI